MADRRLPPGRPQTGRQWVIVVLAVAVAVAAGACGSTTVASSKPPPTTASGPPPGAARPAATVCGSIPTLVGLVLRRDDALPQNHLRFGVPPVVTVTRAPSVRRAASAVCDLPRMPTGTFSCPADIGVTYALVLSSAQRAWKAVTIDASGCEEVGGLGPTRWIARSPEFWRTLGAAVGVSDAGQGTFAGHGPG